MAHYRSGLDSHLLNTFTPKFGQFLMFMWHYFDINHQCAFCLQCEREGFIQKIKDEDGEGCNIEGSLAVNKVAGNFHFMPGKSFHQSNFHVHDLLAFQMDSYNVRNILFSLVAKKII